MTKPDFANDLRERIARAIYARRPDCINKPWPVETAEQRRAYSHNPIAAVDLSYEYVDAVLEILVPMTDRPALIRELIADEAAIDRIAARLCAEVSIETGVIHLSGGWEASRLARELLEASIEEGMK